LQVLNLSPPTARPSGNRHPISLAGIEAATGRRSILDERETLEAIVIAALRAAKATNIDLIVNTAASGDVLVPEIPVTSDGAWIRLLLLNNIVTQAGCGWRRHRQSQTSP
jgi:hypothetical protein